MPLPSQRSCGSETLLDPAEKSEMFWVNVMESQVYLDTLLSRLWAQNDIV
jgi:hypothetical protein